MSKTGILSITQTTSLSFFGDLVPAVGVAGSTPIVRQQRPDWGNIKSQDCFPVIRRGAVTSRPAFSGCPFHTNGSPPLLNFLCRDSKQSGKKSRKAIPNRTLILIRKCGTKARDKRHLQCKYLPAQDRRFLQPRHSPIPQGDIAGPRGPLSARDHREHDGSV